VKSTLTGLGKEIDEKYRIVVGLNEYEDENDEINIPLLKIDPATERIQRERLETLRKKRNNEAVKESLAKLEEAAKTSENLMPYLIDCAHAYVTLGEIRDVLVKVFGIYKEPTDLF